VIAAALPDITESTNAQRFRTDLWYRLSRRIVGLPSLRERREDIPLLARHFARIARPSVELSPELSLALLRAPWPGNVRQCSRSRTISPSARYRHTSCSVTFTSHMNQGRPSILVTVAARIEARYRKTKRCKT
jgi:transcriptional regulator with PAS, ATPase and Fis domain